MRPPTWLRLTVLSVALGGALLAWSLRGKLEVQVTTAPLSTGPIVRRIVATGTMQAVTTVDVGTQVSGTIESLDADYNSMVKAGQVLARLDPAVYEANLLQAQAGLTQARADADGAKTAAADTHTKLVRSEALAEKQLIPEADLASARAADQESEASLWAAQSQVEQANRAVEQANVDLDHTVIRSPIDGIVLARNVDAGQTVASALQTPVLFRIATDFRRIQLQARFDQSEIGDLQRDQPVTFEVESYPDEVFCGRVSEVRLQPVAEDPSTTTAGSDVVTYIGIIDVDNPDEKLRPGMTATVTLNDSRRANVTRIPNSALAFRPPADVLRRIGEPLAPAFVADTDHPAAKGTLVSVWQYDGQFFMPIPVRVGVADDRYTELVSGPLRASDQLVTAAVLVHGLP